MIHDRQFEAFIAAQRIMDMIDSVGIDLSDPRYFVESGGWNYELPDDFMWANGASRLVIWDGDYCDYVVKIPLNECDEKYCKREVEIYNAAIKEGLSDHFAWCTCYSEASTNKEGKWIPGIYYGIRRL